MVEKATKIIKTAKWGKSHQKKILNKKNILSNHILGNIEDELPNKGDHQPNLT